MITRKEALELALEHLSEQFKQFIDRAKAEYKVTEKVPLAVIQRLSWTSFDSERLKNCWVIYIPSPSFSSSEWQIEPQPKLIICISKDTGEILYVGSDGGQ
ncbi:MAG: hypothetical protein M0Z70_08070 [Nitrospiraceae bacterium]|nr:hypothetical protein [Nitrospirota bacterium]MDA8339238.1 hypothetical protein [Nitrospiraceae bacterium]